MNYGGPAESTDAEMFFGDLLRIYNNVCSRLYLGQASRTTDGFEAPG